MRIQTIRHSCFITCQNLATNRKIITFNLKGHCHGGKTWKNQADFFKFGSWAPGGITTIELFFSFITLVGIVIFIKTGRVFVGIRCCKMCFCTLKFCTCQPVTVPLIKYHSINSPLNWFPYISFNVHFEN